VQSRVAPARRRGSTQSVTEATLGFALAQTRYRFGLSSIADLSEAYLQQISTEIDYTNARDQYRVAFATLNYEEGTNPRMAVLLRFAQEKTRARNNPHGSCHFTIESAFHKAICCSANPAFALP